MGDGLKQTGKWGDARINVRQGLEASQEVVARQLRQKLATTTCTLGRLAENALKGELRFKLRHSK